MDTNGTLQKPSEADHDDIAEMLASNLMTTGYRPTLPPWALLGPEGHLPYQIYLVRDIELMRIHPMVKLALEYFRSGISGAEFEVLKADPPEVGEFVMEQCKRFWDRGVPIVQHAYEYGWLGGEHAYTFAEGGQLKWNGVRDFSPWDTYLLTQEHVPVGVRVKNILKKDHVDLWMASRDVPAKALWFSHEPRYGSLYGQSQYVGAWRPWRRLAWKDAAETVIDGACYRAGFQGPLGRYPEEDLQTAQSGVPATTADSQGNPRRFARDAMRQICEQAKAGASVGLPSTVYPGGSQFKWELEWPKTSEFNVSGLIEYIKYLKNEICGGIGVPMELIEAADTGSGYSGRKIPVEAFLAGQQRIGDRMLAMFINQVLAPLVCWNWGRMATFDVKLKNLLMSKTQQQSGMEQGLNTSPGQGPMNAAAQQTGMTESTPGWPRDEGATQQAHNKQAMQGRDFPFSLEPFVSPKAKAIAFEILERVRAAA